MDAILELKKQIEQVILLLEQRLMDDPDRPILRYKKNNGYWWV